MKFYFFLYFCILFVNLSIRVKNFDIINGAAYSTKFCLKNTNKSTEILDAKNINKYFICNKTEEVCENGFLNLCEIPCNFKYNNVLPK